MSYVLNDGTETSALTIRVAFEAGKAVLVYSWENGYTKKGLMLDGIERDTRGACYSVWEEVWTSKPKTFKEALDAAYFNPSA